MKFNKPKHKDYKNTEDWLRAVYKANEAVIQNKSGLTERQFVNNAKSIMKLEHKSAGKAVGLIERSRAFTTYEEQATENLKEGIKELGGMKQWQKLAQGIDEKGHFKKIEWDKVTWNARDKRYEYWHTTWNKNTKSYETVGHYIDFKNSPQRVEFGII